LKLDMWELVDVSQCVMCNNIIKLIMQFDV